MRKLLTVLLVALVLVVGLNAVADAGRATLAQRVADLEKQVAELEEGYYFLKDQIWFVCQTVKNDYGECPWGFPKGD